MEMCKVFHGIKATVGTLEGIGRSVISSEDLFVYLSELFDPQSCREWKNSISDSTAPPSYESLELFIEKRLHTLEAMLPAKGDSSTKTANASTKTTRSHHARKQEAKEGSRGRCTICQDDHFVMFCEGYKKKTAAERKQHVSETNVRELLRSTQNERVHIQEKLFGVWWSSPLVTSRRVPRGQYGKNLSRRAAIEPRTCGSAPRHSVRVIDRSGVWHHARALVDQGSESSIVSERLAQQLRLPRSSASVTVFGVGGKKTGVFKGKVLLTFRSRWGGPSITIAALVLPQLTIYAGGLSSSTPTWAHPVWTRNDWTLHDWILNDWTLHDWTRTLHDWTLHDWTLHDCYRRGGCGRGAEGPSCTACVCVYICDVC